MTSEALTQAKVIEPAQQEQADDIGFARRLREIYSQTTLRPGEDRRLFRSVIAFRSFRADLVGQPGTPADVLAHIDAVEHEAAAARARQRLLQGVEQYVVSKARRLTGRGVELEDLIQEGNTGVLRAMETYDPSKGYAFLTYADDWISQRMLRACEREGSIERYGTRVPCHQYTANGRVQKVLPKLRERLGREPTPEELHVEAKLQNVQQAETALELLERSFTSLDAQRASDDSEVTVGDAIADPQAMDPVKETMDHETNSVVWKVFAQLNPQERQVMGMVFGVDGYTKEHKQVEICEAMGITKNELVRIKKGAMRQLAASPQLRELRYEDMPESGSANGFEAFASVA